MLPKTRVRFVERESKGTYDSRKSDRNGQMGIKGDV